MDILLTGGTGFLGSALARNLYDQNNTVTILTRNPQSVRQIGRPGLKVLDDMANINADSSYQAVINLAGAPIFAGRWTPAQKQLIRSSRIGLTERLLDALARMPTPPQVLVSGSAIGYYGCQGDTPLTEYSAVHEDFSQQLCHDWEQAARQAEAQGTRVCLIRTGLVVGAGSGFLQRMLLPFRFGLGGRLGNGQQWMSWIHLQDWLGIAQSLLYDTTLHGPYNATAPHPVTNREFTRTLAACLHRPALLTLPASLLKLGLGEMSELLLGGQNVLPQRLLEHGYSFRYPLLSDALQEVLSHE
ncbi:TIGR01777 family oxidoreductase [Methylovulum psychrotolerans]|uniref:TIGR01777 family oxidoreductase n=1 Tax=Methylovulum psychrotolerans TaxID=1704499 RepID=UPI001BFF7F07|nr:TIGR01777 family oxidoreductase [Methylovulum psychrotolerans]MBT9099856.1 TIGR01777 family oxidoreductase [Methylovulum psychrotolerans]